MSLKNKIGLPVPEECLLHQAVLWLAKGELPIDPSEEWEAFRRADVRFERSAAYFDRATFGEAMESLILALRSGRLSATGIFWGEDPKADARQNTTVNISPLCWEWENSDFASDTLEFPDGWTDQKGRFGRIVVSTKELFDIFGSDDGKRDANRGGRKPKYDWNAFYAEISVRADLDGLPETAAELQRDMADWCQNTWGAEPSETMLKEKIAPIYRHPRKSQGR